MLKKWVKNIGKNITELKADNKKSGKAKWAGWKVRSKSQILAIALNVAIPNKKLNKKNK